MIPDFLHSYVEIWTRTTLRVESPYRAEDALSYLREQVAESKRNGGAGEAGRVVHGSATASNVTFSVVTNSDTGSLRPLFRGGLQPSSITSGCTLTGTFGYPRGMAACSLIWLIVVTLLGLRGAFALADGISKNHGQVFAFGGALMVIALLVIGGCGAILASAIRAGSADEDYLRRWVRSRLIPQQQQQTQTPAA